jgi:hypothetical protein
MPERFEDLPFFFLRRKKESVFYSRKEKTAFRPYFCTISIPLVLSYFLRERVGQEKSEQKKSKSDTAQFKKKKKRVKRHFWRNESVSSELLIQEVQSIYFKG